MDFPCHHLVNNVKQIVFLFLLLKSLHLKGFEVLYRLSPILGGIPSLFHPQFHIYFISILWSGQLLLQSKSEWFHMPLWSCFHWWNGNNFTFTTSEFGPCVHEPDLFYLVSLCHLGVMYLFTYIQSSNPYLLFHCLLSTYLFFFFSFSLQIHTNWWLASKRKSVLCESNKVTLVSWYYKPQGDIVDI